MLTEETTIMKLDCSQKELHEAVQLVNVATSGRTATSALFQSMLIEVQDGTMRLVGTDSEIWVERVIPVMITEPGQFAPNARLLNELISSLPEGDVHFEQINRSTLKITQGSGEYKVAGMPPEDFPDLPNINAVATIKFPLGEWQEIIKSVSFATAAENQGRKILTGVLIHYDGETLKAVATDTHRLAVRSFHAPGIGDPIKAIVPARALTAINRLSLPDDSELTVTLGDNQLCLVSDGVKVVAQLIEGEFPPYERVIPTGYTKKWQVDREVFSACLKRAGVMAKDPTSKVVMESKDDVVFLSARSEGYGEAKEEFEIIKEGDDIQLAFNSHYLLDALSPIDTPGVVLEMSENDRPAVIKPSESSLDYLCVVMPMSMM